MKGPKVLSEARRREASESRGGRVPQYGVWELCPQKIKKKINFEIAYFSAFFCKLKWPLLQWRQGRIRQQALQNGPIKMSSNLQTHSRCP